MSYHIFLGNMLCPVAPSKIDIKINGQNDTVTLINEGEINILKQAGLSDISFDLLLPNVKYPFAVYTSGFVVASYYLARLEKLKTEKKPFQFIVSRTLPNGRTLAGTNMAVSLEEYSIKEDSKEGFDVVVSVKLKQWRSYGAKTCKVTFANNKPSVSQGSSNRSSDKIGIGSDVIVNGRLHRDSYGKGAGQMRTNYRGKVNFINMKGSHPYHITTPSGDWQGWVTASSVKGV